MRVAIDARALLGARTGIGTYTLGIARALQARAGVTVGLFAPRPVPEEAAAGGLDVRLGPAIPGMLWTQTAFARRAGEWGADVLLAALTIAPMKSAIPVVSVVHDLTPVTHPEWHAERTLAGFLPFWDRTAEQAARFVCVSEATARELARLYPDTNGRVRVACNGVDATFSPLPEGASGEDARRGFAGGRPFVLFLGTLEPRKNVAALVEACERLWDEGVERPDLVLAGGVGWKTKPLTDRIESSRHRSRIHRTGYAPRETARDLYRAAEVFAFPSFDEGFGLPLAEAMACGAPCVASTAEALVEVGGEAALYAPAGDSRALAAQIARALDDPETRRRLRSEGPRRMARFTWETAAAATAAALEEAAS